jgi:DNA helicase HerA-like ATPase
MQTHMFNPILIGKTPPAQKGIEQLILPQMANRHGLITGATGTGKTVTLQKIAESFSKFGVPVFMSDIKGDLSGISQRGSEQNSKIVDRLKTLGLTNYNFSSCPVTFWDVFAEQGHPLRAAISEMGPLLLSRMLNLNDVQAGVLMIAFKIADDNGLLLIDLKDLRSLLQYVGENAKQFTTQYGNISAASVGTIQRGLLTLEQQGGDKFFGEPALDLMDLIQTDSNGQGMINMLAADNLMTSPKLYATFLLWLLSELYEQLPEVGDLEKPKLLFFFDEAHLLFNEAPEALLEKVEQVVRLIRSKGVGVYFCTQNPIDIPLKILGQLGNRVQHALRAFTPLDQKAVKTAADTFRQNPKFNTEAVISQLGVGEALTSFLDEKGIPGMVERVLIVPPFSQIGPVSPDQRQALIKGSVLYGFYEKHEDRESAYEVLTRQVQQERLQQEDEKETAARLKEQAKIDAMQQKRTEQEARWRAREEQRKTHQTADIFGSLAKSAARAVGSSVGRQIIRGVLGGILGSSRKGW